MSHTRNDGLPYSPAERRALIDDRFLLPRMFTDEGDHLLHCSHGCRGRGIPLLERTCDCGRRIARSERVGGTFGQLKVYTAPCFPIQFDKTFELRPRMDDVACILNI